MFCTSTVSKRRIERFNFFNWLPNVKNLVLSNGSKQAYGMALKYQHTNCDPMALKYVVFPKDSKKSITSGGWELRPQISSVICLSLTSLLNTSLIYTFWGGLSPLLLQNLDCAANTGHGF